METLEIIHPVFPFNLLIDLDYGVLQYVRTLDLYNTEELFHQFFFTMTPREIKTELNNRKERNPLSILALNYTKDKEFLDNLYEKCMTMDYLEVQKRAVRTSCVELFKKLVDNHMVAKPIAIYSNEYQKRYYDILFNDCLPDLFDLVPEEELNQIKYDTVYVKYIDDLDKFSVDGGNIYIADLRVNIEMNKNHTWVPKNAILYGLSNVIHIFNIYPIEDDAYNYYFEEEIDKNEK